MAAQGGDVIRRDRQHGRERGRGVGVEIRAQLGGAQQQLGRDIRWREAAGLAQVRHGIGDGARIVAFGFQRATPGKRFEQGVSEILWLDDNRLLVLERAGVEIEGVHWGFHCRLYLADLSRAGDVSALPSLTGATVPLAAKTLLIDFDAVRGAPVGNVEGMAWAPAGRFGGRRLVFVTDNNFDPDWTSELLVFKFRP